MDVICVLDDIIISLIILLKMIRKLVYSRTNEEFNNKLQTMRRNQTFLKYDTLTKRYFQGGMSGLFYFELRVNCPQTMSLHQTMLMCPFESQKI